MSLNLESYVTGRSITKPTQLSPFHLENWGAETHFIGKPLITTIRVWDTLSPEGAGVVVKGHKYVNSIFYIWEGTGIPTRSCQSDRNTSYNRTQCRSLLLGSSFDRNFLFKPLMNDELGLRLMLPTIVNSFKYQVMAPTGAEKVRREKRKWTQRMEKMRLAIISVRRDSVGKDINTLYPKRENQHNLEL